MKKNFLYLFFTLILTTIFFTFPFFAFASQEKINDLNEIKNFWEKTKIWFIQEIVKPVDVARLDNLERITSWHTDKEKLLEEKRKINEEKIKILKTEKEKTPEEKNESSENPQDKNTTNIILEEIKSFPYLLVTGILLAKVLIFFLTYPILFWITFSVLAVIGLRLCVTLIKRIFGWRRYG